MAENDERSGFFRTRHGVALLGFMAIAGYLLWTEHRAHVVEFLPYLLILACPLMHLFHHGHGGHKHDANGDRK
jgi:hypothetical protein